MDETLNTHQGLKSAQQPTGIGARLKSAREALHLTEKDVAARLHLNTRFIHMMENETFENGLPETFVRGYFRSYARLLNLNEGETNTAIGLLNITPTLAAAMSLPVPQNGNVNHLDRYLRWVSYLIISLLFILVITWWASHPRYNEAESISKNDAPAIPALPETALSGSMNAPDLSANPEPSKNTITNNASIKINATPTISIHALQPQANNTSSNPTTKPGSPQTPLATASNAAPDDEPDVTSSVNPAAQTEPHNLHLASKKSATEEADENNNDVEDIY